MKVLLISDYGYLAGGAELMMLRIRDELRQRGHDARLFSTQLSPPQQPNFADYHCVGTLSRFRTLLQSANPWAAFSLSKVLKTFQPDVVHVRLFLTQLSPLILPLLKDLPSIYHVAWYRPICPKGTKILPDGSACHWVPGTVCLTKKCLPIHDWIPLMLQMRLFRQWRHHFDLVVANSHAVKERLEAEGITPVEVVHNGIPVVPLLHQPSDTPTVAFVGRLVHEKGVHVLIDAFEQLIPHIPNARLLIAGDGPERENLQQRVQGKNLNQAVEFLGQVSQQTLVEKLQPAWVQVVPSVWAEPFGIVAVEAMMRGQPVIASDHGGLSEIVEDGRTGFLVPPGDPQSLFQALQQILGDREKSKSMGAAGYTRAVEHFSLAALCDRFVDFYHQLT